MAQYQAAKIDIGAIVVMATSYDFKPATRQQWNYGAAEVNPGAIKVNAIEYVWIGPGGDTDSDNAYWG